MSTVPKITSDLNALLPVNNGTLTLDAGTGPVLADQLARLTNGNPIVVHNAVRTVNNGVVTVTGQTNLLNVTDMPVSVIGSPGAQGPEVTARFTLIAGAPGPNAWRFSRSFPGLPAFTLAKPQGEVDASAPAPPSLLDTLVLADAAFILTTAPKGADPVTGAPTQQGFNFAARCTPTGLLGLLGSVISGGGTVLLYGPIHIPKPTELTVPMPAMPLLKYPWQLSQPPPGLNLMADLGIDHTIGTSLRLHEVALRIYVPPSNSWLDANQTYMPALAASARLDVPSAAISLGITISGLFSTDSLTILGSFQGVTLGKLGQLVDLAGSADLATYLPADVQKGLETLNKLSLEAIIIQLGEGFAVDDIGIAVSLPGLSTTVLPGFTLQKILANFDVSQPFAAGRSLSVTLEARVEFLAAPFDITLNLPEVSGIALLSSSATLPLHSVFNQLGLPAPPDLTINQMQFAADKDGSFSFAAEMAEKPSWTLDLGPVPLTVSDVTVLANRPAGSAAGGSFAGQISLASDVGLAFSYQTPGDFVLRGNVAEIQLLEIINKLTNQHVALPGNFDLTLTDSSVLIQKSGNDLMFQLATTMQDIGTVAFEAKRVNSSTWGFAAGVDLTAGLSSLPGLGALSSFEKIFKLNELLLVVSSFPDTNFQFPSLAAFNAPTLQTGALKLPAQAGGVIPGLNVYAMWTIDTSSRQQQLLRKFLGLNPSLGITLQVGSNPSQDSRLYVSYNTTIQGLPFSCQFGGQIKNGEVGLFLTGELQAMIQSHRTQFDVTMLFVANGALLSGSMLGSVTFEGITLSNLAVVVGIDWEGIPSLGIAATLTAARFQSSLAIFFDSADPTRSMLAGALSNLSLRDVLDTFAGRVVPSQIDDLIKQVALIGTSSFILDGSLAAALDNLQADAISAGFAKNQVTLPSSSSQLLVVRGKPGQEWFLTDMTTMLHYELVKTPKGIQASLQPQFYVVPQTTNIGTLHFDQGTFLNTGLQIFIFQAMAKVLVKPSQGVSVDGTMNRIVLGSENLFSIQSADGKGGPRLSAATFNQPAMPDPALRGPHFLLDGQLNFLGLKRKLYVNVNAHGFGFDFQGDLVPGSTYDLNGKFSSLTDLSVGGAIKIGIGAIDLGSLGKVNINTGANGTLSAGVQGTAPFARFNGGFQFAGRNFSLSAIDLDVMRETLDQLPKKVLDAVVAALKNFFLDASQWAALVRTGVVIAVADVTKVLHDVYHKSAQEAAQVLRQAGYSADQVASGLKSAYNLSADGVAAAMRGGGFAADQVGHALKSAYGLTMDQAAKVLKGAGYAADQVGNALKNAYGASANAAASALKGAGFAVDQVGNFVKSAYNLGPDALKSVLQGVGYAGDQVKGFFNSLGGSFADNVKDVVNKLDPTKWG